ncbi:MAG: histidine phosphatase family protein [Chloroflexi bacterium]|nr:histidine phosphatase family protein [Chloroflexota bacterium]
MPSKILLIRHGQTEWNLIDRFRGRAELELDQAGRRQAEATAARLSDEGLSAVYSSPLKRAASTAQVIAQATGVRVDFLPDLTDVDYGDWQGLTLAQAQQRDPKTYAQWRHSPGAACFPRGETMEQVRARVAATVDSLRTRHIDQTIAIVSHVVVCRLMVLHLLDLESDRFWSVAHDNCGITTFVMRGELPVAIGINDICHLR